MSSRALIERAWLEWRVTKQCSQLLDAWLAIESVDVPGWFVARELGFAFDHGPSILATFQSRVDSNRRRRTKHP